MRIAYSAGKVATFCGLGLARALDGFPAGSIAAGVGPRLSAMVTVALWATVLLCLVRGAPVIVGGLRRHLPTFIPGDARDLVEAGVDARGAGPSLRSG
jgi:hypothetical protein